MSTSDTTCPTGPRLPRRLMLGGSSVALIARPMQPGVLAHKPSSQTRTVAKRGIGPQQETYYIAACAAGTDDPDEAYQHTAAWADHLGAVACTEPACFPEAVAA